MLRRLKRGTALALAMAVSLSIIGTMKPTKAYADFVGPKPPTKIVTVMKKDKSALADEFDYTVGGKKLHYKRKSDIKEDPNFTMKEIAIAKERKFRTQYWVYPRIENTQTNTGYFNCKPTNSWNSDRDPNKIKGNDGMSYKDGYVKGYDFNFTRNGVGRRSLAVGIGNFAAGVINIPDTVKGGEDFLNQNHVIYWEGIPVTLCMRGSFDNNIFISTTKEAALAHLNLDMSSDLDPDDYSNRYAYMEHRVGHEDGIEYKIFEDYVPSVYERGKTILFPDAPGDAKYTYNTKSFVFPPKSDRDHWKIINNKWAYLAGEYGDEVFHYYTPAKVLGTRYLADYEVEDIIPPPPPQKPDTAPCGRIVYNPDKCIWTNRGKISNGVGDYSIDIKATKPRVVEKGVSRSHDVCESCGEHSCHTYTCNRTTDKFDVVYDLDRIETSGATNDTVRGGSGTIHIRQEGRGFSH